MIDFRQKTSFEPISIVLSPILAEIDGYTYWRIDLQDLYQIKAVNIVEGNFQDAAGMYFFKFLNVSLRKFFF